MSLVLDYFKLLWLLVTEGPCQGPPMSPPTLALPSGDTTIKAWRSDFVRLVASSRALQELDAQTAQQLDTPQNLLQLYKDIQVLKIEYRST
jgi:hypothetical protein